MGKKTKKTTNKVFKVAGAKNLKAKSKPKVVKTQLKNINVKTKSNVSKLDKELSQIQNKVRASSAPQKNKNKNKNKLPSKNLEKSMEVKKKGEQAMEKLETMQL